MHGRPRFVFLADRFFCVLLLKFLTAVVYVQVKKVLVLGGSEKTCRLLLVLLLCCIFVRICKDRLFFHINDQKIFKISDRVGEQLLVGISGGNTTRISRNFLPSRILPTGRTGLVANQKRRHRDIGTTERYIPPKSDGRLRFDENIRKHFF